jgi:hypothetical protein
VPLTTVDRNGNVHVHVHVHVHPDATFALIRFASGMVGLAESSWFVPDQALTNVITPQWGGTIDAELVIVGTDRSRETISMH